LHPFCCASFFFLVSKCSRCPVTINKQASHPLPLFYIFKKRVPFLRFPYYSHLPSTAAFVARQVSVSISAFHRVDDVFSHATRHRHWLLILFFRCCHSIQNDHTTKQSSFLFSGCLILPSYSVLLVRPIVQGRNLCSAVRDNPLFRSV
jgi:hypothetical protein